MINTRKLYRFAREVGIKEDLSSYGTKTNLIKQIIKKIEPSDLFKYSWQFVNWYMDLPDEIFDPIKTKERKTDNMITKRKYSGHWVIGIKPYSNNLADGYLDIVLCYLPTNNGTPYVTWIYNHSDGGFHEGHYHERINDAIPEFLERGYFKYNSSYISDSDAIECHYRRFNNRYDYYDHYEAKDAQLVSVYLHNPTGGITFFTDHLNGLDAMRIVRYISNKYELPIKYQPEGVHYIKLQPIIN